MDKIKYLLMTLAFLPTKVLAQSGLIPPPPDALGGRLGDSTATATDIILYFINLVLLIVGIVAVLFLIIGGFRYITSAGNDESVESAKKTIQNAIIGLIVVILAYVIVTVITNALIGNV